MGSASVDLSDTNDARTLTVLSVPAGARVIQLGGGSLDVARALEGRGCRTWLIAPDERTARGLARHCVETLVADLEEVDLTTAFGAPGFDAVLAVDVLHRVRAPAELLRQAAALLPPSGRVVATVPNVAHGALRLELLRGRFRVPGGDAGGPEPLHAFDAASAEALIEEAGLSLVERLNVTRRLHETEAKLDPATFPPAVVSEIAADPDALVYEFVLVASPTAPDESRPLPREATLAERLQARTEELAAATTSAQQRAAALEERMAELHQRIEELTAAARRVEELESALEAALRERRALELDVAVKDAYITELRTRTEAAEEEAATATESLLVAQRNAHASLAEAQESLVAQTAEADRLRERASELDLLHHRVAGKVNRILSRYAPIVHRGLRSAAGRMARRRSSGS